MLALQVHKPTCTVSKLDILSVLENPLLGKRGKDAAIVGTDQ